MKTSHIDQFLTVLSADQKKYLLERLKSLLFGNIFKTVTVCPCCNDSKFVKSGLYKGIQKFKCKNTSRVFTFKSNTILSYVYKLDKLTQLVDIMGTGRFPTIREINKEIGVSMQTAFDWRTKIMTAIYEDVELKDSIIEFDETNFRLSRKGRKGMDKKYTRKRGHKLVGDNKMNVKVFMAYSRATNKVELYESHMGRTSALDVANYLGVKKGLVIYSDKHQSYGKFYNDYNVPYKTFTSLNHINLEDNTIHNQHINQISGALGNFVNDQLRGVSTKYLQGYCNWQMFVQNGLKKEVKVKEVLIDNRLAFDIFKQKEREFKYFLRNNGRTDYGYYNDRYYGGGSKDGLVSVG